AFKMLSLFRQNLFYAVGQKPRVFLLHVLYVHSNKTPRMRSVGYWFPNLNGLGIWSLIISAV
ncbi:MAG: hypothetical protein ACXWE4_06935, partial [Methylobacter sp.]